MNVIRFPLILGIAARAMFAVGMLASGIATAQPVDGESGMEVLTRGPVHEAFAEAVVFDPDQGIIVSAAPPDLIEEIQPDQRPVGSHVAWIPGYWGWDEDQTDFLWISGVWRNLPPGREWVPGYWAQVDTGYQWTSGYWQNAEATEVSYLPEPPHSLENGPGVASDSNGQTWIPGNWRYVDNRYAWRGGYWMTARANWCWTPSYYRWSQRGYVYVDGYWDYPVESRGVVFAPVRFQAAFYQRPGFVYSPLTVISLSVFTDHLFVRPGYGHYYFGDYYDSGYRNHYYASYDYGRRFRGGYDPIFAHDRWQHRNEHDWLRNRENDFAYRRDHVSARPPRTWSAYNRLSSQDRSRRDFRLAESYDQVVGNRGDGGRRFQQVTADERGRYAAQGKAIRGFGRERQQREMNGARISADRDGSSRASRMKVGRSPMVGVQKPPVGKRDNSNRGERGAISEKKGTGESRAAVARNTLPDRNRVDSVHREMGKINRVQGDNSNKAAREVRAQPGQGRATLAKPIAREDVRPRNPGALRKENGPAVERSKQSNRKVVSGRTAAPARRAQVPKMKGGEGGNGKARSRSAVQPREVSPSKHADPARYQRSAVQTKARPQAAKPAGSSKTERNGAPNRKQAPKGSPRPSKPTAKPAVQRDTRSASQRVAVPQRRSESPARAVPQRKTESRRQAAPQRKSTEATTTSDSKRRMKNERSETGNKQRDKP